MNQSPSDRKDRNGGGDVTKADKKAVSPQKPTKWQDVGGHVAASEEG